MENGACGYKTPYLLQSIMVCLRVSMENHIFERFHEADFNAFVVLHVNEVEKGEYLNYQVHMSFPSDQLEFNLFNLNIVIKSMINRLRNVYSSHY